MKSDRQGFESDVPSPESYVDIDVASGEEFRSVLRYGFYRTTRTGSALGEHREIVADNSGRRLRAHTACRAYFADHCLATGSFAGTSHRPRTGKDPLIMKVVVVTNDFPPRIGGINDYVAQLVRRFPADSVTVCASTFRGADGFDRNFPQEVIRFPTDMLLPTPGVRQRLHGILRERRPDIVLFGAIWPLGHMGPAIHRKLDIPYGGFAHGLELTGARVPGLLRHIGANATLLTAVSDWARRLLEPAFGWQGRMQLLPSGIDVTAFHPGVSDADVRERHRLGDAPVICCVSRLVARKGQDMLIRALPQLALAVPRARLLIVGTGPYERTLRNLATSEGVADRVVFAGAVPYAELPAYFRAGSVFAMPCRSRLGGLDVEALGAVFLQAAAVGRAVVAGDSGGAPEAIRDGETGLVVNPGSPSAIATVLSELLTDPARSAMMGSAGASWVKRERTWDAMAAKLLGMLDRAPAAALRSRTSARSA